MGVACVEMRVAYSELVSDCGINHGELGVDRKVSLQV